MFIRRYSWELWLAAVLSSFAALESLALRRGRIVPLSHALRRWLGLHPRHRASPVMLGGVAGFLTWLIIHLGQIPEENR